MQILGVSVESARKLGEQNTVPVCSILIKSSIACVKRSNETSDCFSKRIDRESIWQTNRYDSRIGQLCSVRAGHGTRLSALYGSYLITNACTHGRISCLCFVRACVRACYSAAADFRRLLLWLCSTRRLYL